MRTLTGAVVFIFLAACVESSAVPCGDGRYCPAGSNCATVSDPQVSLCVPQEQLDVCADAARYQACTTDNIAAGRCYDGVCLAVGCGNGRLDAADPNVAADRGELCEDGNQISGDGCAADCISNESCGNGVVDAVQGEACDDRNFIDNDGCTSRCELEAVAWTRRTESDPINEGHREGFAMAYDSARNQVVLFGGTDSFEGRSTGADLDDTWLWDGTGWVQVKPPVSPQGRFGHAMAYDAGRQRVVLFGGFTSAGFTALADTWEWDGSRWTARVTGAAPGARSSHVMTYDSKRDVVVLYGGDKNAGGSVESPEQQYSDTWLWDGTSWTLQVSTSFPNCVGNALAATNGRNLAAFAFDAARGVAVLFGGGCYYLDVAQTFPPQYFSYSFVADDKVWELDATGWTMRTSSGPTARSGAAMAFSPVGNEVLMIGGSDPLEQWAWNGQTWTQSLAALPPRPVLALATDTERRRIVMFGSQRYVMDVQSDEQSTHEWNGTAWSAALLTTTPQYMDLNYNASLATYDMLRGRAIVVATDGTTYERVATGWTTAGTVLPATPRAIAYDAARAKTVVFGVNAVDETIAETWTWNGVQWSMVAGAQPSARTNPAMTFDAKRGQVVLFGGYDYDTNLLVSDTWTFDGATWTRASPAQSPPARYYHVLAYDPMRGVSVLVGGFNEMFDLSGDTWLWDGSNWSEANAVGPEPRAGATLAWQVKRERLALVGGWSVGGTGLTDVWEWSGTGWEVVEVPSTILGRGAAVLLPSADGGGVILSGGVVRQPVFGLSQRTLQDDAELRWQGAGIGDSCTDALDLDGDMLAGCADPDCAITCTPLCPASQAATCSMQVPRCGDATCAPGIESCRACPADCGPCTASCGDNFCDGGETAAVCAGDC